MNWPFVLPLAFTLSMLAGSARAADTPQSTAPDLNEKITHGLVAALEVGVPIFNKGEHDACYRVYQGALLAVKPLLDPEMQQKVQARLDKANLMKTPAEKAFELRAAIDEVRRGARKSLWDRLGGEPAVTKVVHDFVAAAAPDPKVNFLRNGKFKLDAEGVAKLERKLVEFVSSATGGPLKYTGKDMKAVHTGMKITDPEFDALAGHLVATLKKFNVPQAEIDELVKIVGGTKKDIVGQ